MNKKMKECFTPHVATHSLFGLGLGLLLSVIFPSLQSVTIALGVMVVAVVLDAVRKN